MLAKRTAWTLRGATFAAMVALAQPGSASANDLKRDWPRAALASNETCSIDVRGPGQFFVMTVTGLVPSEKGEFLVLNNTQEFAWRLQADKSGKWETAYMPYLRDASSGVVLVNVQTPSCYLSVSFPWSKSISSRGN